MTLNLSMLFMVSKNILKYVLMLCKVLKGQLLDVLDKHTEVIKHYQQVFDNYTGTCDSCCDIDRKWLEDHISNGD
jgi:hypothetical protein